MVQYVALARKYRPKSFADLVGQRHVSRTLSKAVESGRLHHAYLFSGTRGVGKTTLGRIIASAFLCESSNAGEPCLTCDFCTGIRNGSLLDFQEIDAASRTGIDDMRELLENVQYLPVKAKYKIYLIDEVHMLSQSSFNALLKTLEEPPEHVKFIFATTELHKILPTILSRCLQFQLKKLSVMEIAGHLKNVLEKEGIEYDDYSLNVLATSADGSMRDGLSLLDQAISYGEGKVCKESVEEMLGGLDQDNLNQLLSALLDMDAKQILEAAKSIQMQGMDLLRALNVLAEVLHATACFQQIKTHSSDSIVYREWIQPLSERFAPEEIQLFYEIVLKGVRGFSFAPSPHVAFEMTLLRLLVFSPVDPELDPEAVRQKDTQEQRQGHANASSGAASNREVQSSTSEAVHQSQVVSSKAKDNAVKGFNPDTLPKQKGAPSNNNKLTYSDFAQAGVKPENWSAFVLTLSSITDKLTYSLLMHSVLLSEEGGQFALRIETQFQTLVGKMEELHITQALQSALALENVQLILDYGHIDKERMPVGLRDLQNQELRERFLNNIDVKHLLDRFDGRVMNETIVEIDVEEVVDGV